MKKLLFFLFLIISATVNAQHVRVNQIKSTGQPEGRIVVTDGATQKLKISTIGLSDLGAGTVTNVTATSPIFSSGGTQPNISIQAATATQTGSMSASDKAKLDSDTDQSPTNELNTNIVFNVDTKELGITDAGGTRSATIDINVGNAVNSYVGTIDVVSSTVSVTWPDSFSTTNYFLRIDPYYVETIGGKSIRISNAVYDFVKTTSGFSLKLDTVAGYVEYFAADTTNIYPIEFENYVEKNAPITPATNTKITYDSKGLVTGSASATATDIVNTPAGTITGTTAQSAINELDSEKKITSIVFSSTTLTTTQGDGTTASVTVPTFNQSTTGQAGSVANSYVIKFDTGTTEGTDLYTYNGSATKTIDIKAGSNISITKAAGSITIASTASGGISTATGEIWTALTGTYASATTFTFAGTDKDAKLVEMSLFTCTNSTGATRRIGYVKTATNSSGTITCNVVTDTDLASGDKDFKVAYNRKVTDYKYPITIPGECIADASYSQGMFYTDFPTECYLLPVDASVLTAAAGTGAALTWNVYKGATNLFSSAPDMTTNTVLRSQRPTTNTISAADNVSLRILTSAGATNKAADFQAKLYIVPQGIFTAFGFNWILIIGLISVAIGGSLLSVRTNKKMIIVVILFCSFQGFGQKVVGCWRMNGNSNDASGNSYNLVNTNVTFLSGGQNGVASLSGTGYMRSGNNLGITSWSSPISIELICKINVEPASSSYVLFCWQPGGTSSNGRFVICYNYVNATTNVFVVSRYHESPADYDECAFNIKAGTQKYYHIVGTYNGTTLKLYINGNYITSFPSDASGGTSTTYSAANTSIGSYIYNNLYKSNASIDKCIVYNGELSVASIKNKYSDFIGIYQN